MFIPGQITISHEYDTNVIIRINQQMTIKVWYVSGKSENCSDFIIKLHNSNTFYRTENTELIDKDRCFSGSNVAITRYDPVWVKKSVQVNEMRKTISLPQ